MCVLWEEGDTIVVKRFPEQALENRNYVFDVISRDPGPFMGMKRIRWSSEEEACWNLYYHAEGCRNFDRWAKTYVHRNRLELYGYLKMMEGIFVAMEEAEKRMIMTSSFEINMDTIWYHDGEKRVKIMYVPSGFSNQTKNGSLWKSRSVSELLLEFLQNINQIDAGFSERWPHLQRLYLDWDETHAGWHYCIKQIRSWIREFPEELLERRSNRSQS